MTPTQITNTMQAVDLLLKAGAGQVKLVWDKHWLVKASHNLGILEVQVTFGWLKDEEPNPRWHWVSKVSRWQADAEGTHNLVFQWLHRTVDRIQP